MVLVSTSGVDFGTAAICCRVSSSAVSVCTRRAISRFHISSHLSFRTSLKLKCCLVISSTRRASLPRWSIWPFYSLPWAYTLNCIPGYQLPVSIPITRFHCTPPQLVATSPTGRVSRMLPGVPRMNRVSAERIQISQSVLHSASNGSN